MTVAFSSGRKAQGISLATETTLDSHIPTIFDFSELSAFDSAAGFAGDFFHIAVHSHSFTLFSLATGPILGHHHLAMLDFQNYPRPISTLEWQVFPVLRKKMTNQLIVNGTWMVTTTRYEEVDNERNIEWE
jgi:hypothetical protein